VDRHPSSSALPLADELSGVFARMSGLLLSVEKVATALGLLTSLARETIPAATGAGVTIVDERGRRTSGATDSRAERGDALQYELDEGPCLTATLERRVVRIDDLDRDPRWPRWNPVARELGFQAVLSAPMVVGDQALGAVKVYADRTGAFGSHDEQLLGLFAAQAAVLVANVQTYERAERLSEGMRQAVRDRDVIGLAKGVLMARHGVDEEAAFGMLLSRATSDAVPLREAARVIADSAVRRRR
jgi:GAF domain-containing protein